MSNNYRHSNVNGSCMDDVCMRLRCIQLYVTMLNKVNCYLIFTWKIDSLGTSIASGYAAIAHFKDHPMFGVMYYVLFCDATLVYILLYEGAFKVPELFHRAKSLLRLSGKKVRHGIEERY